MKKKVQKKNDANKENTLKRDTNPLKTMPDDIGTDKSRNLRATS